MSAAKIEKNKKEDNSEDNTNSPSTENQPRSKGRATPLDQHLGKQLRVRRNLLGMSQERLADLLGLTFQQVQKYERGKNRISASRLFQLSKILDVPIDYFFKKLDSSNSYSQADGEYGLSDQDQENYISDEKLYDKETLDLIRIYYSIDDPKLRKNLFTFIKSMVNNLKNEEKEG